MKSFRLPVLALLVLTEIVLGPGCANMLPPTGGPRDTSAPRLVTVNPANLSRHFDAKRIVFTFDEYVELKDVQQNLTVSPVPKMDPLIEYKLKTVTVKIRDTLQPNTTYSIDFGKAIRDINEGNILRHFSYIFTTGSIIDSLELNGNIILAATGLPDSNLIAMLHSNMDDSAVIKDRPAYFARCDSSGRFRFRYLKAGKYRIYALKDESGQKKYLSKTQFFGFADEPLQIGENNPPITLYAYNDTTGTQGQLNRKTTQRSGEEGAKAPGKDKDKVKRLIFTTNVDDVSLDILGNFEMHFQTPLKFFDSTHVRFTDDKYKDLSGYRFFLDSLKRNLSMAYKWVPGLSYRLIATRDFAEDTLGQRLLKTDTLSFRTRSEAEYGSVRIRFVNLNLDQNPILQFTQGGILKKSRRLTTTVFSDKLFIPGEYELRILYDTNRNGVWDPGEFFIKHRQPERVVNLRKKLTIKANWDNQTEYIL